MYNREKLIAICQKYVVSESVNVVIKEPYIPYVPKNWNGMIVLAESQNLSSTNEGYVQSLKSKNADKRINRLC